MVDPEAQDFPEPKPVTPSRSGLWKRVGLLAAVVGAIIVFFVLFGDKLNIEYLAEREDQLKNFKNDNPIAVYGIAFLVYVVITGLSLPGATALTLVYGWFFNLAPAVVLVSFASTTGATVAFLLSRYLFRDAIERQFGSRLATFNNSLEREGPFFLFALRLIPLVPFFVINAVMGLTPIRTFTFWWVSQLGMLAGTIVYVYAGDVVPDLRTLADEGLGAVFTPGQLIQITVAFTILALFPIVVRILIGVVRRKIAGPVELPTDKN